MYEMSIIKTLVGGTLRFIDIIKHTCTEITVYYRNTYSNTRYTV